MPGAQALRRFGMSPCAKLKRAGSLEASVSGATRSRPSPRPAPRRPFDAVKAEETKEKSSAPQAVRYKLSNQKWEAGGIIIVARAK